MWQRARTWDGHLQIVSMLTRFFSTKTQSLKQNLGNYVTLTDRIIKNRTSTGYLRNAKTQLGGLQDFSWSKICLISQKY